MNYILILQHDEKLEHVYVFKEFIMGSYFNYLMHVILHPPTQVKCKH